MTPTEAAAIIGCHPSHVRWLCRQGKLRCEMVYLGNRLVGYNISLSEARRYRDNPDRVGYPIGKKRNKEQAQ